jgi:hypothetical protein
VFVAGLGLFASLFIKNIKIQKEAHPKDKGADAKEDTKNGEEKV